MPFVSVSAAIYHESQNKRNSLKEKLEFAHLDDGVQSHQYTAQLSKSTG